MKPILIQIDEPIARLLEKYVPARGRKRSKFIRQAVLRALMDLIEVETGRAYKRNPDNEDEWFDPEAWAPPEEAYILTPEELHKPEAPVTSPRSAARAASRSPRTKRAARSKRAR